MSTTANTQEHYTGDEHFKGFGPLAALMTKLMQSKARRDATRKVLLKYQAEALRKKDTDGKIYIKSTKTASKHLGELSCAGLCKYQGDGVYLMSVDQWRSALALCSL